MESSGDEDYSGDLQTLLGEGKIICESWLFFMLLA